MFFVLLKPYNFQFWPRHWQSMVYFMVAGLAGFPFGAAFGGIFSCNARGCRSAQAWAIQRAAEGKFEAKPDFSWDETITGINRN